MTLEPATAAHAAALAAIHASAFPEGQRWGQQAMALQLGLPGGFGYIAPAGGMVLARVAADEAEILTIAVHPDAQRQGLGRELLRCAMQTAATRGARAMFLEVAESNAAARALYAACGFSPVGRRPSYYRDRSDALLLHVAFESRAG